MRALRRRHIPLPERRIGDAVCQRYSAECRLLCAYDDVEYDRYKAECSSWDEGDRFFGEPFADWHRDRVDMGIRPYNNAAGEVDYYRLELTLNELGRSFLVVNEFATSGLRQLTL
jgi:hypothetical protein